MASTAARFISSLIVVGADVERAAEDVGEAQDVVDLVGIVRAARCRSSRRAATA